MMAVLAVLVIFTLFLLGMNLWTRRLTHQSLSIVPQPGQVLPLQGAAFTTSKKVTLPNRPL